MIQIARNFLSNFLTKFFRNATEKKPQNWNIIILDVLGYIGCIALIIYVASRWGTSFFDPYLQNDDVRAGTYKYWAFTEDGGYFTSKEINAPLLYKYFFLLILQIFDLLTATKVVQILAIAWGAFHVFQIGRRRAGGLGGLFSLYLALHTYMLLERTGGAHSRAFAFPIILMTIDGIDRNSERQSLLGAILGFSLYPPVGLIALTTHGIWMTTKFVVNKSDLVTIRKALMKLGLVTLFCLMLIPSFLRSSSGIISKEEARLMPEFGKAGRINIIPLPKATDEIAKKLYLLTLKSGDSPLPSLENFTHESGGIPLYFFISFALLLAFIGLARPPNVSLYIAIAGIILFGLSTLLAFRLYHPERMIMYSVPVAILYLLSSTYTGIGRNSYGGIIPRLSSLIVLLIFIGFFGIAFKGPLGLKVNTHYQKELFQFLQTLPGKALFAGHPDRMSNIPFWAKRGVLTNYETGQSWSRKGWKRVKELTYDNFDAYYASTPEPLLKLSEKYGVDYMLVHELDLTPLYAKNCYYFEPFTTWLKQVCRKPYTELIWRKATPLSLVGKASGFYIIDLNIFLEQLALPKKGLNNK